MTPVADVLLPETISPSETLEDRLEEIRTTTQLDGSAVQSARLEAAASQDLRLAVAERVETGSSVEVELRFAGQTTQHVARGTVHWEGQDTEGCQIGVLLDEPLPQSVRDLLAVDERRNLRYPCNWPIRLKYGTSRRNARILNYSRCGGLITWGPLEHQPSEAAEECDDGISSEQVPTTGTPIAALSVDGRDELLAVGHVRWCSQRSHRMLLGLEWMEPQGDHLAAYFRRMGTTESGC